MEARMRKKLPRRLTVVRAVLALGVAGFPGNAVAGDGSTDLFRSGGFKRVGSFTQWGISSGNFVKRVDTTGQAAKLTHINYAFGNVNAAGKCFEANEIGQGDAWADYHRPATADASVDGVADSWGQPLAGNF